ncbi:hypothetical protein SAMN05444392_102244 [Seinonella peptonophila]|uniref:ABC-2 family transporter protein n=2 Tax=Seinonella peptonophila TaxID=112248 RepID=A0A1M4V9C4_9BACL|nr:hypothetical protein SAMN05444392_102244 [Seinonella peptonophila]
MKKDDLQRLRKQQWFYINGLYLFYIVILCLLLAFQASAFIVYTLIGIVFLLQSMPTLIFATGNPLLAIFPPMRTIWQYEREKLGVVWRRYYLSQSLLQILVALFAFVQAWLRWGQATFLEGVPIWYIVIAVIVLIYIGNLNQHLHIRRFDQMEQAKLIELAKDRSLFTMILAAIFLVFLVVGTILVGVVFR